MFTRTRTSTGAALAIAASLLLFTGCSSSTTATDEDTSQVDEATSDESAQAQAPSSDTSSDVSEDNPGPTGGAVYTDPASDSVQVTVSESGFDPSSISVAVGGTVTFTPSDDGPHGLYVGDLDSYSAMGGLTATFRFDIAGTYRVYDEITETEATVTAG